VVPAEEVNGDPNWVRLPSLRPALPGRG
jgi:hypothetical protein